VPPDSVNKSLNCNGFKAEAHWRIGTHLKIASCPETVVKPEDEGKLNIIYKKQNQIRSSSHFTLEVTINNVCTFKIIS